MKFINKGQQFNKTSARPRSGQCGRAKRKRGPGEGIFARPPVLGGGCALPSATQKSVRILLKKGSRFVQ